MNNVDWKKKTEENKKILDGLDLPKPEVEEDLFDYIDRVRAVVGDIELPEDYGGDIVAWLDMNEFGEYLEKRFGMKCDVEEIISIKWTMY